MTREKIIDFLDKKRQQGFTGCVKMAFEDGKLFFITVANHIDLPMTKIFSQKEVLELVAVTAECGFCGQLVFFFNHGKIDFYSFLRSYTGDALEAILSEGGVSSS